MRNRFAILTLAGLMAFGVVACSDDGTDADVEDPVDGAVDPAAPADGTVEDPALEDPALEPTE